ncbi:hypothetical protein [Cellulomonas marina]|uniref:DUF4126 domain-containing protein n=1 Tax=Cellulomonas marina TaxID=988821 RepID=A0A1I0YCH4_9CELL|nr:hypothetical protein [Cellulomonas marina]GIG29656.1 hypothetical protein Cma02nite_22560 [Cellulomonas marina]SFB10892.1 hypothetical protein SAMN05421867_10750 [Cellulomonas marina]
MGVLTRSVTLGLAAGGRSSTGFAVPALVAVKGRRGPGAALVRLAAGAALVGEAVADKLPTTPSRLAWPMLPARVAAGAGGAVALSVLEHRRGGAHLVALLAGAVGGYVGSVAGATWRQWAADSSSEWLQPDVRAALVEDLVVLDTAKTLVVSSPRNAAHDDRYAPRPTAPLTGSAPARRPAGRTPVVELAYRRP